MEIDHWDHKLLRKLADHGLGTIEYGGTPFGGLPYLRVFGPVAKVCREAVRKG